jgi:general secretion pathway protein B
MSYILDALRRADAERERGAVPSLQSQQQPIADDDAAATRPRPLLWAVAGLTVALLATLAWAFFGGSAPPARAPIEGSITAVPTPLPAAPFAPPAAAPSPTISAAPTPAPATLPAPAPPSPAAVAKAPRAHADPKRATATPADKPAIPAAPTTAAATKETGEQRVYAQSELPDEIRRDLPKVVIGGSSYSVAAASRMVMVNGQVFHEGDRLAPGLVLERIRMKSAVLAYKGWRYEVAF